MSIFNEKYDKSLVETLNDLSDYWVKEIKELKAERDKYRKITNRLLVLITTTEMARDISYWNEVESLRQKALALAATGQKEGG